MRIRRFVAACIAGITIATAGVWALADSPKAGFAPDPAPHAAEKQWVFEIAYQKGASTIERARPLTAKKPAATARVMGRFALELWVGKELLDRRRFDVPLLGDDEGERDPKYPRRRPTFARVTTKLKIQMADHPRAAVLAFVDRATGDTRRYFWPPDETGQLTPFSLATATTSPTSDAAADAPITDASTTDDASPADASAPTDAAVPDASPPVSPTPTPVVTPARK